MHTVEAQKERTGTFGKCLYGRLTGMASHLPGLPGRAKTLPDDHGAPEHGGPETKAKEGSAAHEVVTPWRRHGLPLVVPSYVLLTIRRPHRAALR